MATKEYDKWGIGLVFTYLERSLELYNEYLLDPLKQSLINNTCIP